MDLKISKDEFERYSQKLTILEEQIANWTNLKLPMPVDFDHITIAQPWFGDLHDSLLDEGMFDSTLAIKNPVAAAVE